MKTEYPRFFTDCELRVVDGPDGKPHIEGYAAVFNSRSNDLGGFKEEIAPGAFTEALQGNGEVLALVEHDPKMILGRRSAGTLKMTQDDRGLFVQINPADTTIGRDALENVRSKNYRGMSFRFPRGAKDSWRMEGGEAVRTIHKAGLKDITVTAIPAYDDTSVGIRSLGDVDVDELRSYYASRLLELKPKEEPPSTANRDLAEKRLKLLKSEIRCGCDYPTAMQDKPADIVRYVMFTCRGTFDTAQRAIAVLAGDLTDDAGDDFARACSDAADEAEKCAERLNEFVKSARSIGRKKK
jgi:HK97 family phage prohead protease